MYEPCKHNTSVFTEYVGEEEAGSDLGGGAEKTDTEKHLLCVCCVWTLCSVCLCTKCVDTMLRNWHNAEKPDLIAKNRDALTKTRQYRARCVSTLCCSLSAVLYYLYDEQQRARENQNKPLRGEVKFTIKCKVLRMKPTKRQPSECTHILPQSAPIYLTVSFVWVLI